MNQETFKKQISSLQKKRYPARITSPSGQDKPFVSDKDVIVFPVASKKAGVKKSSTSPVKIPAVAPSKKGCGCNRKKKN